MPRRTLSWSGAAAALLLFLGVASAVAAPKVVGLTSRESEPRKQTMDGGYLMRELLRQSVLIAARDGLGVSTRDETLRETLPEGNEEGVTFDFYWVSSAVDPTRFWFTRAGDGTRLYEKEFAAQLDRSGQYMNPRGLALLVEPLSRTELVGALRKAGLEGTPNKSSESIQVPADIQLQLQEMNIFSQFAAVRALHGIHRSQGESPDTLAALARGYANLGQLTAFHFNATHKACRTRALLYANRLEAKYHRNAWSLWNRGYVYALVGLPGAALEELKDAHTLNQDATKKRDVPDWVPIIDAFCQFKYNTIKEGGAKPETRQLAALLAYLAVENSKCDAWTSETAMQALRGVPECYAICDSLGVQTGGVATLHRTTVGGAVILSRTLPMRLAQMRNLPGAVKIDIERSAKAIAANAQDIDPNWADPEGRRAIVKDLVAAGAPNQDTSEPSWEFLGRMIEDVTLVHTYRRMEFLTDTLGLPPDDVAGQLQLARQMVADHPQAGLVDYAATNCRNPDAVLKALLAVPLKDVDVPLYDVVRRAAVLRTNSHQLSKPVAAMLRKISSERDAIASDMEFLVTVGKGGAFRQVSPYSPVSGAASLTRDAIEFTPDDLKQQEFLGNRHPNWQRALGDRYAKMGDSESAIRCYTNYLKLSPDQRGYYKLAEVYWKAEDFVKWRETLEESLKAPDTGLAHARTRVSIADHLMSEGKFKEAEPYAAAAAESYAYWALMCAVRCYQGLEQWDRANAIIEATVRRYPGHEFEWYNWCYVTGHGNLKGATDLMLEVAPQMLKRGQPLDLDLVSVFYLSSGRTGLARSSYRRFYELYRTTWVGVLAAVLADAGRQTKERDMLLEDVIKVATIPEVAPYHKLAQWLKAEYARPKGEQPDLAALDALLEPIETPEFLQQINIVARFFQARNRKDLAQQYLTKAEASPRKEKLFYVMLMNMRTGSKNAGTREVADK